MIIIVYFSAPCNSGQEKSVSEETLAHGIRCRPLFPNTERKEAFFYPLSYPRLLQFEPVMERFAHSAADLVIAVRIRIERNRFQRIDVDLAVL